MQQGIAKKTGSLCMYSGKECQLLRRGGQTKQLEMPVTVLPNFKNEELLYATLRSRDAMTREIF
jgi:hypothetical protein